MNSATELIDWYWSEIDTLRSSDTHHVLEDDGTCQCGTEKIIDDSSNPDQMRSFMMIGVLIDQMMWTHLHEMYSSFNSVFRYPKLNAHGSPGMASPSWFTYTRHGYDKKVNWSVVSDVAQILGLEISTVLDFLNSKNIFINSDPNSLVLPSYCDLLDKAIKNNKTLAIDKPKLDEKSKHGLGLSIVEGVLQAHGGIFNLRTAALGGLEAEMIFPCSEKNNM